ncbi:adenylate kinase [Candidatus Uhrbacteria bacterium CG10_big_fil_rev_8_21_14_0_10_50_16]|uniref:Adenylate kinase n=1 Tax=Candidatus Uhrbacteria bacterium CG10_big_fil_rev_8_21_14_0_10_50_16 TaxID=1975039 RepID=A0A2H0RLY8_9BACT|nr:MAG: adenylate kinase [Candidatus Uhrbacteria bacterium CG10_big_fil_rev_8_21_14_0_10_50_16]
MIILLLGPQGAGKGTQGERLSETLGYPLIGAGALLREEKASGSDLGKRIGEIIDAGNLVPPDMITEMLDKRLQQDDAKEGVLIDGYPRDPEQLRLMFERFTPDLVFVLELDDQTAVERLGGRWMCADGHIYNLQSNPPKQAGVCDVDGGELFQRADDEEGAIRKRLAIYHADTAPLIAQMEERGVRVIKVDASQDIDSVQRDILQTVQEK